MREIPPQLTPKAESKVAERFKRKGRTNSVLWKSKDCQAFSYVTRQKLYSLRNYSKPPARSSIITVRVTLLLRKTGKIGIVKHFNASAICELGSLSNVNTAERAA